MTSSIEEESAELSEAELAQLDALIDEPEPADGPAPAASTTDADELERRPPREVAREFLSATDGALWQLAARSVTIEENASFDALVKIRERVLAR